MLLNQHPKLISGIHPALPHPTSCRLYYVCLNGVTPNEAGCGPGLVFNSVNAKCDDPENVPGCEDTYKKSSSVQSTRGSNKPVVSRSQWSADNLFSCIIAF